MASPFTFFEHLKDKRDRERTDDLLRSFVAWFNESAGEPGAFGNARLGTIDDAREAGLVDQPSGLILGFIDGQPLRYTGDGHVVIYGRTGGGKGRDYVMPNLGLVDDQSFVVVDPKNQDTSWNSWDKRLKITGKEPWAFNPYQVAGRKSISINVMDRVIKKVQEGRGYLGAAQAMASALIPIPQGVRDIWPQVGAQELILVAAVYLANYKATHCHLPGLYEMLVCGSEQLLKFLDEVAASKTPGGVPGRAASLRATIAAEGGQWAAIAQEIRTGLGFVAPDEAATEFMTSTSVDVTELKRQAGTLYIMSPAIELGGYAGKIHQLVLDHLLETLAEAQGNTRVSFLLDEFQNIGTLIQLPKSLQMYRSMGVQLVFFIHHAKHLGTKYTQEFREAIDAACAVRIMWDIEDEELVRKLEYLGGTRTVRQVTYTGNAGVTSAISFTITEVARPLLQPDTIRLLGKKKVLLHLTGYPFFIATRGSYDEIEETEDMGDLRRAPPTPGA